MLIELQNIAKGNIIIMPGSGINTQNSILFKNVGFKEIHTSASKAISSDNASYFGNTQQTVSDVSTIKRILKIVKDEE
jgi:copper homeostasis protein